MRTIKIILVIVSVIIYVTAFSQKRQQKRGDKQFYGYNYTRAIQYYEAIKYKSIDTERALAVSYEMTGQLDKAEVQYESIISKQERAFDDLWNYFSLLLKIEKYGKAATLLQPMSDIKPDDSRVQAYVEVGNFWENLKTDEPMFEIRNLSFNNKQQDFGTVFYKNQIVFVSSRTYNYMFKRVWNGNKLNFLNLFLAKAKENGELTDIKPFRRKINRKYHDGPASFNQDFTLMALTRNNYRGKSTDGTRNLQLFTSEFVDGKWTPLLAFPYNSSEYSTGHASFTPDGKIMYYSSDMPGGMGGVDIYKIERHVDGTWGQPVNLAEINTEGNEMFPSYHKNGFLFFSSDGHVGLGGLDIFMVSINDGVFGQIRNLGWPVNSAGDDFALLLDEEMQKGYFSSNRIEGKGSDDIYFVKAFKPLKKEKIIRGLAKDNYNNVLPNTEVVIIDDELAIVIIYSDSLGRFEYVVEKDIIYDLIGTKDGFLNASTFADAEKDEEIIYVELVLEKIPQFTIQIQVNDIKTSEPIEEARIIVTNKHTDEVETFITPNDGKILNELSDKRLMDTLKYDLRVEKDAYFSETLSYNQLLDREGIYTINVTLNQIVVGDDLGKTFQINPIYFDLDKYNIRPDAAIELDKIVAIMNEYPTLVIELGSHTDCRASKAYNMRLSDNRAKSSAAYIKKGITNPERIYGKGYGETMLVNECECEGSFVVPCTEEQHQMNRRTEFRIIKQ